MTARAGGRSECQPKSGGTVAWWSKSEPQQTAAPSTRTPQACWRPAVTWVKLPGGGVDSPSSLAPQQAIAPLVRTAHLKPEPPLRSVNVPEGGTRCPSRRGVRRS